MIAGAQEASLAVVHARVWTGNAAHPWAEALATNGDTILAVASDFLLAQSKAGKADYLVTSEKSGLLALARHQATRIISARDFMACFR